MEAKRPTEPSLYRDVLKQALALVWRFKFLLLFGFFAAFAANGEQYDILQKNLDAIINLQQILPHLDPSAVTDTLLQFWSYLRLLMIQGSFLDTLRLDAVLLFTVVIVGPIIVGQIALINATHQVVGQGKATSFGSAMAPVGRHFLPFLALNVLAKIVVYGLLALVSYPIFMRFLATDGSRASLDALAIAAFLILIPIQIVVSFIVKFASVDVVIRGNGVWSSLKHAWQLFQKHWLAALEMSVLLIVINVLASLVVVGTLAQLFGIPPDGRLSTSIFYLVIWVFGSLIAAFQYAAWTTLYLRFEQQTAVSKLARWADLVSATLGAKPTQR